MTKIQWSLCLLLLMSLCSLFTCQTYKYHYINEKKTWYNAQAHCKEMHMDLAVVDDMADMDRLLDSTQKMGEAWIGLNSETDKRTWHWSQPGVEFKESEVNWATGSPSSNGNCGAKHNDHLHMNRCFESYRCICYDEKNSTNKFNRTDHTMTWPKCQTYCREHHTDLISGVHRLKELQSVSDSSTETFWIGLFRDRWRWSDDSSSSFRHWDDNIFVNFLPGQCALTVLEGGRWKIAPCGNQKPFICYNEVILIKETKTWEEAVDYCRANHRDLVSITNLGEQRAVQEEAKDAETPFVWVGMRYTCTMGLWFWVSDQLVCYNNWAPGGKSDECDAAGAMEKGGKHQWFSQQENEMLNFICTVNQK